MFAKSKPTDPGSRKKLIEIGSQYGWFESCMKTYEELEATDPIGFGEYNDLVGEILDAASAAPDE